MELGAVRVVTVEKGAGGVLCLVLLKKKKDLS